MESVLPDCSTMVQGSSVPQPLTAVAVGLLFLRTPSGLLDEVSVNTIVPSEPTRREHAQNRPPFHARVLRNRR